MEDVRSLGGGHKLRCRRCLARHDHAFETHYCGLKESCIAVQSVMALSGYGTLDTLPRIVKVS